MERNKMNTPKPCDSCKHCEWNVLHEDYPDVSAWCELEGEIWGNPNCLKYEPLKKGEDENGID